MDSYLSNSIFFFFSNQPPSNSLVECSELLVVSTCELDGWITYSTYFHLITDLHKVTESSIKMLSPSEIRKNRVELLSEYVC